MKNLLLNVAGQFPRKLPLPDFLCLAAFKINDQRKYITSVDISVKREYWGLNTPFSDTALYSSLLVLGHCGFGVAGSHGGG